MDQRAEEHLKAEPTAPAATGGHDASPLDLLKLGFLAPPNEAKPRVWWHWMEGNVSADGIRRDLEWMERVGIGGLTCIDAALNTPVVLRTPIAYGSSAWWELFREGVRLAGELGLEFGIASSPGWSVTGGPWVGPAQAMKKIVWSETPLASGKRFRGQLRRPPTTTGRFQGVPLAAAAGRPEFYADVAVLAYRAHARETALAGAHYVIQSSAGSVAPRPREGTGHSSLARVSFDENDEAWIAYSFEVPQRLQGVSLIFGRGTGSDLEPGPAVHIEASVDGAKFDGVAAIPCSRVFHSSALQQTIAFPPFTGCCFRVVLSRPPLTFAEQTGARRADTYDIIDVAWHGAPRVHRFEDKAGFSTRQIALGEQTPPIPEPETIRLSSIVDLTQSMGSDGSIDWTPPPGEWIIMRFGYALTGSTNHPAGPAATGFEVDKLNGAHVRSYLDTYLGEFEKQLGPQRGARPGLQHLLVDSFEAGPQNWTEAMPQEFLARRGYDLRKWLLVLAGRVVEDAGSCERFLWDFRKTIGELMVEHHYGQIMACTRARGLVTYVESHESHRLIIADGMDVKRRADIPMGAMWASRLPGYTQMNYDADIRESASVAHVYGKRLVAGELFGAFCPGHPIGDQPYSFSPAMLKPVADRAMAMGLNRFVIANSDHQPCEGAGPGLGLAMFGQWFSRRETWAEQAEPWLRYLARSSYLLQQGRFSADLAYFYGEDTNATSVFNTQPVPVPRGYAFDFVNATALLEELVASEGKLVTRTGIQYGALVVDPGVSLMSLPLLRRIWEFVDAGVKVIARRPSGSPSLTDPAAEVATVILQLWGGDGHSAKIVEAAELAPTLAACGVAQDVDFGAAGSEGMRFVHRILEDGHLYFVSNGSGTTFRAEVKFRVTGKRPEIWRADTGSFGPASYRMAGGVTFVDLTLDIDDSVFVVFRTQTDASEVQLVTPKFSVLETLGGGWKVIFPSYPDASSEAEFAQLLCWTRHPDAGIRHFSGTAVYRKEWEIDWELPQNKHVHFDLGAVREIAEVVLNGTRLGVLWKRPFRVDVTPALRRGTNTLEVRVTNLWCNRLIGDCRQGSQTVYAAHNPFRADSPLVESGLLGPVTILCPLEENHL